MKFRNLFRRRPTWDNLRAAISLRGERIGQEVISTIGPGKNYDCLATWQQAWMATGANLSEMRTSAVAEMHDDINDKFTCEGFTTTPCHHPTISGHTRTELERLRQYCDRLQKRLNRITEKNDGQDN